MGVMNKLIKNRSRLEKEDLENRMRAFSKEYDELVRKYKITWKATLEFLEGGNAGIFPKMGLTDFTKELELENENAKKNDK